MKYVVDINGRFDIDINFWNGKAKVSYEGMELKGEEKNTFMLGSEKCVVCGSLFSGVFFYRGQTSVMLTKLFWYDYLIGLLPFLVSVLGGLIGAVLGVIGFLVCYKLMPNIKSFWLRLLICIAVAGIVFLIIMSLASLFPALFGIEG